MRWFRILKNSIKDSFKSVFRNISLSIASITCSTITLILVAIAIVLTYNVNSFTKSLEEDLTIIAVLDRGTTDAQAKLVESQIKAIENVNAEETYFESNEDVKKYMQSKYEVFNSIMKKWEPEDNYLQPQFVIKVKDVKKISQTADEIKIINYVDATTYGEGMVEQLVLVFDVIKKVSVIIVVALIIVTIFLISNTIKLTIYSRKTEIEIMRLIGTSNGVIRLPYVFEGFFLGIVGAIIPIIVAIYGYIIAFDKLEGHLFSKIIKLIEPTPFIFYVSAIILGIGCVVGMFGSYRAVRKYLKI